MKTRQGVFLAMAGWVGERRSHLHTLLPNGVPMRVSCL
jgi:hypothetical protein